MFVERVYRKVFTVFLLISFQNELQKLADQNCKAFFGDGWAGEFCKDAMSEIVPEILKLLKENLDPQEICEKVGLCWLNFQFFGKPIQLGQSCPSDPTCYLCKYLMEEIKHYLSQTSTEVRKCQGTETGQGRKNNEKHT